MGRWSAWVVVSLGWALACGGRLERGDDGDESLGGSRTAQGGAPTGQGGSVQAQSGSASRAGSPSAGGVGTAGTLGVGGATGAGGVGTGGGCACDPIACPPGYISVPSPSGCCTECQIDYQSCELQRENYTYYRKAVLFKYAPYECKTSSDCTNYYDKNECQLYSCGEVLDAASWAAVDAELNAFARMNCNPACPPPPVPPCVPPPIPTCFKGTCE
ncbi:MAG: hypothetical protein K0R38_468 [Polyangiaceae bacterium]|jgi:hypothetical protein|nr:hypothetical protein [Polyangiaceae bacterium]